MKQKGVLGVLVLSMALMSMSCTKNEIQLANGLVANRAYSADKMVCVSGEKVGEVTDDSRWRADPQMSWGFYVTDSVEPYLDDEQFISQIASPHLGFWGYIEKAGLDYVNSLDWSVMNESSFAEVNRKVQSFVHPVVGVAVVDKKDDTSALAFDEFKKWFGDENDPFAVFGDRTYYVAVNSDLKEGVDETSARLHQALTADFPDFKQKMVLYNPQPQQKPKKAPKADTAAQQAHLRHFETTALSGKTISQAVFADYDLTMVNVWATFCGPCIHEMPDLQELYTRLPKNVNLISICSDYQGNETTASRIIADIKGEFEVLAPNAELTASLLNHLRAVPTTVFVDSKGNIVGDFQIGAPRNAATVADSYLALIDNALSKIGKSPVHE